MLRRLFKPKVKSNDDVIKDQYTKSLDEITEHFNGVKINETLVGRIRGMRMTEKDCIVSESDEPKFPTMSSVPRPKSFGNNLFAWIQDVRDEAKLSLNKNREYEQKDKERAEQLKAESNRKALEERRKFYVDFGLLSK